MSGLSEEPEETWRQVAVFLGISFAFSWAYVLLYERWFADLLAGTTAGRITPYFAAWGPLIAVTFLLWQSNAGLREWFDRQLTVREPLRLYLLAVLIPNAVSSAAMIVFPVQGMDIALSFSPVNFVLVFVFTFALLGALEEFGWRGFLQPTLQTHTTAVRAAIIVGLLWGVWHIPSYLFGHLGDRPLGLFLLHLVPMSIVMAWLYNRAEGLLPAMVFHASHNAPGNVFTVVTDIPPSAGGRYYLVYTVLWLLIGGMVVLTVGPALAASESSD